MKKALISMLGLLVVSTLSSQNCFAQDYTRWGLPQGAVARLGKGEINEISYSPDGTQFALASDVGIWLLNAHTGTEIALLTGHSDTVSSVAYSPDGTTLASGSYDGTIRLWDTGTGWYTGTIKGHTDGVNSVVYSPDGKTLASGSSDATIRLWDAVTGNKNWLLKDICTSLVPWSIHRMEAP